MKTALITGSSGFVGKHLVNCLIERNWNIFGSDLNHTEAFPGQGFFQIDLNNSSEIQRALKKTRPDVIFHLAGVIKSNTPKSFFQSHVFATTTLFDSIIKGT